MALIVLAYPLLTPMSKLLLFAAASIIAANRADASFPALLQRLGHAAPAEAEAKQLADVLLKHDPLKQRVKRLLFC